MTPTPTPTPTSTLTPTSTPTQTPSPTSEPSRIVINEVAWAGTKASSYAEWVELFNIGDTSVDLTNWSLYLVKPDGTTAKIIVFQSGTITAGGYFVIAHITQSSPHAFQQDDPVQPDISGPFSSSLPNTFTDAEYLGLFNMANSLIDRTAICTNQNDKPIWCGGSASPMYVSMERISATAPGSDPANWASNNGTLTTGLDAAGNPIQGTPKYKNSVSQ